MEELGWHEILTEAVRANKDLSLKRPKGERQFDRLLREHPEDGMIYYERGEAYEFREEFVLAENDYRKAEEFFPLPRWKEAAREGLDRVRNREYRLTRSMRNDTLGEILHRIHSVPDIPHFVGVDAFLGVARFYSHPYLAAAMLRIALERWVVSLLDRARIEYSDYDTLKKLTGRLGDRDKPIVSETMKQEMIRVIELGNHGIHLRDAKIASDHNYFKPSLLAFAELVELAKTDIRLPA